MARIEDTVAGPPPSDDGGRRFGRYLPVRELGRGGMGVVYVAHDPHLGRDVALKVVLAADKTDRTAGPRLLREAQAAARLSHPGIVVVLDVGLFDGLPYLAMELVDGPSLSGLLERQGPLAPAEAARIGAGLARALEHAHAQGVVHRDLKPANVLLAGPGRDPKIVDFGLAKDAEARGASLTMTGEILGTPPYMAPEQADGSGKRADGKADVYALGATLHAMLTGEPPFKATSTLGLLTRVLTEPAKPPSARRAGIPRALDALVLRCLEKEPARRPTAAEVAGALEALGRAPAPTAGVVAALAVVALVAAVAGAGLVARGRPAPTPPTSPTSTLPPGTTPPPPETTPLPPGPTTTAPVATADLGAPVGPYRQEEGWRWTRCEPEPPPVVGARAVYEPIGRRVLVVGGARGPERPRIVLAWSGVWRDAGELPAMRHSGGLALDAPRDLVVYLGGVEVGAGKARADLWVARASEPTLRWQRDELSLAVARPAVTGSPEHGVLAFGGMGDQEGKVSLLDAVLRAWTPDGWRDHRASPSPPARSSAACCWDARRGRFVLFGGLGDGEKVRLDDLWEWDGTRWREGPRAPAARSDAAMVFDGKRCLLFGGLTGGKAREDSAALNDLWAWDGDRWSRLLAAGGPSPRSRAALAWHAGLSVGLLVGGQEGGKQRHDVAWTLAPPESEPEPTPGPEGPWPDEPGWSWRLVDAPGGPPPSDNRVAVHDPAGQRVLVLGGHVGAGVEREVVAWDGAAWSSVGELPEPRHAGAAALDAATGTLYYAGGRDPAAPGPSSDLWLTPLGPGKPLAWERANVPEGERRRPKGSGRLRPALVWDDDGGRLLLHGGTTEHETLDDLWVRAAGSWSRVNELPRPKGRFGAAAAWDAQRKRLVVFGGAGRDLDDALGDVWEWDGAWSEGPRGPPARAQACLVYDGRRCLLVGGARSDRRALDDAWAWSGTGWARLAVDGARPSRRARAAMAWDAARRVAVLVGGSGQAAPCPDVVWELVPPR